MASQEVLDQLGDSSSTSQEGEDDASTSSEEEMTMAAASSSAGVIKGGANDASRGGVVPVQKDNKPKPKKRIKLSMRPSVSSTGGDAVGTVATAEVSNGVKVKEETVNGTAAASNASMTAPTSGGGSAAVKPPKAPAVKVKTETTGAAGAKPSKTKKVLPGNAKTKAKLPKADAKPKKVKVKKESASGTNGTAKISVPMPPSAGPPKKKNKKKLSTLPLSMKRKLPTKGGDKGEKADASSSKVVKATVVDSSEAVEAEAVATVVENSSAPGGVAKPAKAQPAQKKQQPPKPIRLPPMTSPGLLIAHAAAANYKSAMDANGFAKPQAIFEQSMAAAGYTTEGRTKDPHRGSSVQRVVGDMFDSDVGFALNFPDLVPKELWNAPAPQSMAQNGESNKEGATGSDLPNALLKCLGKVIKKGEKSTRSDTLANGKEGNSRKRSRPWEFRDMIPASLTIPYPESFIEKRLKYVKEVEEREKAIITYQETQEKLEIEQEEKEFLFGKEEGTEPPKIDNPVKIPPIPVPPSPPPLSEFKGLDQDQFEGTHPIYFPKGKKNFVAHLDSDCFHVTEGRYFGLASNTVADPHFVGANAPGIAGLPVSGGSGLATTSTTSGSSTKPDSVLAVLPTPTPVPSKAESSPPEKTATSTTKKEAPTTKPTKKAAAAPTVTKSATKSKHKQKHVGPTPTANSSDLRKIFDAGGEMAEEMKKCIIRAAVHASRSGKHGQSFLAPDGKAYPDVSKAFAAHAGLKPCTRCKNNKQGVSKIWLYGHFRNAMQ
jgi:hypothetical protein